MYLPSNVKNLRKAAGLTYRGLAAYLNMSTRTIYDLENNSGENAKLMTVIRIAEYFGVSLDDLIYKDLSKDSK